MVHGDALFARRKARGDTRIRKTDTDRDGDRQRQLRETVGQTHRETERHRDTETQRHRDTERSDVQSMCREVCRGVQSPQSPQI
jgi:hypothetical protein